MAIFRTHRQAARANNRLIALFFAAMAIVTAGYGVVIAGHYLFSWW